MTSTRLIDTACARIARVRAVGVGVLDAAPRVASVARARRAAAPRRRSRRRSAPTPRSTRRPRREVDLLELRRAELGPHPVDAQPLRAVGADEAVDLELRGAAVDLEREHVLPLRPAHVEHRPRRRCGRRRVAEDQRGVVLDRRVPELGPQQRQCSGSGPASQCVRSSRCMPWSTSSPPPGALRLRRATRGRSRAGRRARSARAGASPRRAARSATSAAARASAGWKRWLKPTLTSRPARAAASLRRSISRRPESRPASRRARARRASKRLLGERRELVVGGRDDHHVGREREQLVEVRAGASAVLARRDACAAPGSTSVQPMSSSSRPSASARLCADQSAADDPDAQ